ncbi:hypothetical protein [Kribbella swartbergensis]
MQQQRVIAAAAARGPGRARWWTAARGRAAWRDVARGAWTVLPDA